MSVPGVGGSKDPNEKSNNIHRDEEQIQFITYDVSKFEPKEPKEPEEAKNNYIRVFDKGKNRYVSIYTGGKAAMDLRKGDTGYDDYKKVVKSRNYERKYTRRENGKRVKNVPIVMPNMANGEIVRRSKLRKGDVGYEQYRAILNQRERERYVSKKKIKRAHTTTTTPTLTSQQNGNQTSTPSSRSSSVVNSSLNAQMQSISLSTHDQTQQGDMELNLKDAKQSGSIAANAYYMLALKNPPSSKLQKEQPHHPPLQQKGTSPHNNKKTTHPPTTKTNKSKK